MSICSHGSTYFTTCSPCFRHSRNSGEHSWRSAVSVTLFRSFTVQLVRLIRSSLLPSAASKREACGNRGKNMKCVYCGNNTRVVNSRLQKKFNQTWRRRRCLVCEGLFTSIEAADLPSSILFRVDAAHAEPFQRDILFLSIYEACRHRKHAVGVATLLTDTVLGKLRAKINEASISRASVISVTSDILKHYDKAAWTMYSAYHPLNI